MFSVKVLFCQCVLKQSVDAVLQDVESQTHRDLLAAFSSLVNQEEFSDVVIEASHSTLLYAHRVILSVRCPALLQVCPFSLSFFFFFILLV